MSKHTEGPWDYTWGTHWTIRKRDSIKALAEVGSVGYMRDEDREEEEEANARLIAKSPDMVELLCEVLFSQTLAEDLEDRIEKCVAQALGPENMPKQRKT